MSEKCTILRKSITIPRFGEVQLATTDLGICSIALPEFQDLDLRLTRWEHAGFRIVSGQHRFLDQAHKELKDYALQRVTKFSVPVDLRLLPLFTTRVLKALGKISFGNCLTYGEVAKKVGNPSAARAVGGAVGRNPIPIIVPCHRVVATAGIGGFGLGLTCKRLLLEIENVSTYAQ